MIPFRHHHRRRAFTLIEMLVVIAIIGVLAAMIIPVGVKVSRNARIKHTEAQRDQLVLGIEAYKEKLGQYPPDNPEDASHPPLVYELTGVRFNPQAKVYQTVRGNVSLSTAQVSAFFGIGGFVNATLPGSGDDAPRSKAFAASIDSRHIAAIHDSPLIEVFVSPYQGPSGAALNPWRYAVGPRATFNPTSYDLWVDIKIGKRTYRICNWSQKPLIDPPPHP